MHSLRLNCVKSGYFESFLIHNDNLLVEMNVIVYFVDQFDKFVILGNFSPLYTNTSPRFIIHTTHHNFKYLLRVLIPSQITSIFIQIGAFSFLPTNFAVFSQTKSTNEKNTHQTPPNPTPSSTATDGSSSCPYCLRFYPNLQRRNCCTITTIMFYYCPS